MSGSKARRIQTWAAALVAVAGTAALQASADTLHVNGSCGSDAWTGTSSVCEAPNGPKLTIQAGTDAGVDGDTREDALSNAREAIDTWIEAAQSLGRDIPIASLL